MAARLRDGGHDAIPVRDVGLGEATEEVILEAAAQEQRILDAADANSDDLATRRSSARYLSSAAFMGHVAIPSRR